MGKNSSLLLQNDQLILIQSSWPLLFLGYLSFLYLNLKREEEHISWGNMEIAFHYSFHGLGVVGGGWDVLSGAENNVQNDAQMVIYFTILLKSQNVMFSNPVNSARPSYSPHHPL